jgi:hypothetical protein
MPLYAVTPFRVNFFRTLVVVWRKRISLRYWCRECGQKETVEIYFGQSYPQFLCRHCQTKNVINIKYK